MDRYARATGPYLVAEFRDEGVSGTDLTAEDDDPTRLLIRQILGAIARFAKALTVSKLKAARLRKRRSVGRKTFGTRPGQAEILALIRRLRRKPRKGERLSFAAVAKQLNAEARPTESPPTGASSSSVPVQRPREGVCSNERCE